MIEASHKAIGQEIHTLMEREGLEVGAAAKKVLKKFLTPDAALRLLEGEFGEWSFSQAEAYRWQHAQHPAAPPKGVTAKPSFDMNPMDIMVVIGWGVKAVRKRLGDVTSRDVMVNARLNEKLEHTFREKRRACERIAKKIPKGSTLQDVWDKIGDTDQKFLLGQVGVPKKLAAEVAEGRAPVGD